MLRIARIVGGTVVNIEMASQDWLDAQDDPAVTFVLDNPAAPAFVGLGYDPVTGFEQPSEGG